MTDRPMTDEEWAAMTERQWLEHRIERCLEKGWTANKERYERVLKALIEAERLSAAVRGMREALEACAAPWVSSPTTVTGAFPLLAAEFQRRLNIAGEALAVLSGIETEQAQARLDGLAPISIDTKGTTK